MKKNIGLFLAAAVFILIFASGCSLLKGISKDDGGADMLRKLAANAINEFGGDLTDEERENTKEAINLALGDWPADLLPEDMPKYPDGVFFTVHEDEMIAISVTETSEESFNKYTDELKSAGYAFKEAEITDFLGGFLAVKDGWNIYLLYRGEGTAGISAFME